jgi:hypothetical protein
MSFAYLLDQLDRVNGRIIKPGDGLPLSSELLLALQRALSSIRFGTVELVIHDGRVVQVERREKIRVAVELTQSRPIPG